MDRLPVCLDLRHRRCVVVGAGPMAAAKAALLAAAGADVLCAETVRPGQLDGAALLVVAGGGRQGAGKLAAAARARGVMVNVVDRPELSDLTFPAIVDRSPVVVAISTDGAAPSLAQSIRAKIEALLPVSLGRLAAFAGAMRPKVRSRLAKPEQRRRFWRDVFGGPTAELMLAGDGAAARAAFDRALEDAAEARPASGIVHLVGAGPGDPELLTLKALRLLQSADAVVHDRLAGQDVLAFARREAERHDVGKRPGHHCVPQAEINRLLIRLAASGKTVVRLKGGDPLVFGRGGEEIAALAAAGIAYTVVPGVTAATACAAAAGVSLTHRDHAQAVTLVTGHTRDGGLDLDWTALARPRQTVAVYMGVAALPELRRKLMTHGLPPDTPAAAVIAGTTARQRVIEGTLGNLELDEIERGEPALILIGAAMAATLGSGRRGAGGEDVAGGVLQPVAQDQR